MYARLASRAVARRGFHTTRAQLSSPYHYPEGPLTNVPFNARSKWFAFGYWGFMATGFGLPFAISGEFPPPSSPESRAYLPCSVSPWHGT